MEGIYIYGIIEASEEKSLGIAGITAYEEVYTIPHQDISAVVSDSEMVNYTTLVKDVVARYLLRHQQVIEKVMDSYTIIPMRLGTYAFNTSEVEEILSKGYTMFKDIFRKINNKIEMDVVATWSDLNSIIKEIGEEQDVKRLKEESMSKPEGVSFEDQIRIGNLIKNILDNKRERCALEIETGLKDVSIDFRKHDLMDDRMIFNIAFLIDKNKKTEFERRLDELDAIFNEKLNFRCVGPLPPYSFYTTEVKKIPLDDIELAKRKLCLNNMATKDEIIKAYRSKANLYHPDKNINSPDAEKQFNEIVRAYKILLEYCDGNACLPDEKEFSQNAIIIKVRE
ncbi:MAG: GvpL/GvpF family gas vesicle protein [Thermodesulfovibrionales bacterium]|nr:GvpL/GvpF family gas vesicle protein [Thermodesulfovibrionales bacterium]